MRSKTFLRNRSLNSDFEIGHVSFQTTIHLTKEEKNEETRMCLTDKQPVTATEKWNENYSHLVSAAQILVCKSSEEIPSQ